MILLIDNYDSFTYNLVQRLGELDATLDVRVFRNDQIKADDVADLKPSHVIISPGPCTPNEAGVSNEILRRYGGTIPTLGVCLGHQCIGHVFGGEVVRNYRVMHSLHQNPIDTCRRHCRTRKALRLQPIRSVVFRRHLSCRKMLR